MAEKNLRQLIDPEPIFRRDHFMRLDSLLSEEELAPVAEAIKETAIFSEDLEVQYQDDLYFDGEEYL